MATKPFQPAFAIELNTSKHAMDRMNQRGIQLPLVMTVFALGIDQGDKVTLTKKQAAQSLKEAQELLNQLNTQLDEGVTDLASVLHDMRELEIQVKCLKEIEKKDGMTIVVTDDQTLVTAYRSASRRTRRSSH